MINILNKTVDSISHLVFTLIIENNYSIEKETFKLQLLSHPEFPSLKSITDSLDYFSIENLAIKVPKNSIDKLPKSFIAFLNEKELVLVVKKDNYLTIIDEDLNKKKINHSTFNKAWTGDILALENNNVSKTEKKKSLLIPFWICMLIFSSQIFFNSNLIEILFFFTSLVGVLISVLITKKELGYTSILADKICDFSNENYSCGDVIHSNENKIFNIFSLSDLGIVFFLSITFITILNGFNYLFFSILLYSGLCVVFIALHRQFFILKKICSLCLLLSLTILTMNVLLISSKIDYNINFAFIYKSFSIMIILYFSWLMLKPILQSHFSINELRYNFQKFKRNFMLFETLLFNQSKIDTKIRDKIIIGDSNSIIKLDVITNPLCGFCKKSFEAYKSILENKLLKGNVSINFIFYTPLNKNNISEIISIKLLEEYKKKGEKKFLNMLEEWFKKMDIDSFLNEFIKDDDLDSNSILQEHYNWCKTNNITTTPKTLINGYLFPNQYEIDDISYFINELLIRNQNISFRERLT